MIPVGMSDEQVRREWTGVSGKARFFLPSAVGEMVAARYVGPLRHDLWR
jgi:hypothetical protein